MKNNKNGFTLAEVLITMGLIGVIAALTAPALVKNARNEANAARLSVAISNLENAFTNAIAKEGVDGLNRTSIWVNSTSNSSINGEAFYGNLGRYLLMTGYSAGASTDNIKAYYGDSNAPYKMTSTGAKDSSNNPRTTGPETRISIDTMHIMETKSGATIFIHPSTTILGPDGVEVVNKETGTSTKEAQNADKVAARGGALTEVIGTVIIDVNGKSQPNTAGRDLFAFYLGNNGILYPYGGSDVAVFQGGNASSKWDAAKIKNAVGTDVDNTYSCTDGAIAADGWPCTARIIAEDYKMNY